MENNKNITEEQIEEVLREAVKTNNNELLQKAAMLILNNGFVEVPGAADLIATEDPEAPAPGVGFFASEIVESALEKIDAEKKVKGMRGQYNNALSYPIDQLNREIFRDIEFYQNTAVTGISEDVAADKVRKCVYYTAEKIREIESKLNSTDKMLHAAIGSLTQRGIFEVSPVQLYRLIYGQNTRPTEKQLKELDESIFKMSSIIINLDTKEILEAYPGLKRVPKRGNLIYVASWYGRTYNGKISQVYTFGEVPILFLYAYCLKQITPLNGVNSPFLGLPNTPENREIKDLLFNVVLSLKKYPERGYIKYKSIFERIGVDFENCDRIKKKRTKDKIKEQAAYLQKSGYIRAWKEYPEKKPDGIILLRIENNEKLS